MSGLGASLLPPGRSSRLEVDLYIGDGALARDNNAVDDGLLAPWGGSEHP